MNVRTQPYLLSIKHHSFHPLRKFIFLSFITEDKPHLFHSIPSLSLQQAGLYSYYSMLPINIFVKPLSLNRMFTIEILPLLNKYI